MALQDYLHSYLGSIATQLSWTTSGSSYDFSVSEALRIYGVTTEAEATDLNKLYAFAKMCLWDSVLREISFDYDYSANGASFKRSQLYDRVKENLDIAVNDVLPYLDNYQISTGLLGGDSVDPYSNYPYEDR